MNDFSPRVSVLMPVYNGEQYLDEAVQSILCQTFRDFEFLIIDDGSTDGTKAILDSYNDERIRLVRNERNMGLTKSLNRGLVLARGDYIARQDADDVSHPERLAKQVQFLESNPQVGMLGTAYQRIDVHGLPLSTVEVLASNSEIQDALLYGNRFCHGSVMLRQKALEAVGNHCYEMAEPAEDYDLWLRMSERFEVANLPEVLYSLRMHSASLSSVRAAEQRRCARMAVEKALERRFREYGSALVSDEALARCYLELGLQHVAEGDCLSASKYFDKSLEVYPQRDLWESDFELLALRKVMDLYHVVLRPSLSHEDAALVSVGFVQRVSRMMPSSQYRRAALEARMLSELRISMAFACYRDKIYGPVPKLCLLGLWGDRRWLGNRGVLSIAIHSVLKRANRFLERRILEK